MANWNFQKRYQPKTIQIQIKCHGIDDHICDKKSLPLIQSLTIEIDLILLNFLGFSFFVVVNLVSKISLVYVLLLYLHT